MVGQTSAGLLLCTTTTARLATRQHPSRRSEMEQHVKPVYSRIGIRRGRVQQADVQQAARHRLCPVLVEVCIHLHSLSAGAAYVVQSIRTHAIEDRQPFYTHLAVCVPLVVSHDIYSTWATLCSLTPSSPSCCPPLSFSLLTQITQRKYYIVRPSRLARPEKFSPCPCLVSFSPSSLLCRCAPGKGRFGCGLGTNALCI